MASKKPKHGSDWGGPRIKRRAWSKGDVSALRGHSKKKTPVASIARTLHRSAGAIKQKALSLGLPIGHRR
jgi:hypothetical protein